MSVLDIILVKELINTPTTVNLDYSTDGVDISDRQDEFSVQVDYDGGVSVDIDIHIEVSNDNVNFASMGNQKVTDNSGTHIFDVVGGSGTIYMRISFVVNTGSIIVQRIQYAAKRLH